MAIGSQKIGQVPGRWQNLDMTTPLLRIPDRNKYAQKITKVLGQQHIQVDPVQHELIEILDRCLGKSKSAAHPGIYIYGPPGRGKTLIMNTLVSLMPPATRPYKMRKKPCRAVDAASTSSFFLRVSQNNFKAINTA